MKRMKCAAKSLLFFSVCCQTVRAEEIAEDFSGHSLVVGVNRVQQQLTFERNDIDVAVVGRLLQYQYFNGDWMGGVSLTDSSGDESSSGATAYQLDLDGKSVVVFIEHTLRQIGNGTAWLGAGVGSATDEQSFVAQHSAQRFIQQRPVGSGDVTVETRSHSLSLDGGYSFLLDSSSISVSTGLTQQWLHEEKRAVVRPVDRPEVIQQQSTDEQTLIAGLSAGYETYWLMSPELELAVFAGARYQYTLGGDGQVHQSQLRRGARGVQQGQRSESFQQENDSASAMTLRLSLFFQSLNLAFEVDKFSDQAIADAYYGVTAGVNF